MVRIVGVSIPDEKYIDIALTYIYGIGRSLANKILQETKISSSKKTKDLSEEELNRIKKFIDDHFVIEGELRRQVVSNIRRLKGIECWRGIRHLKGLPVRGQKTRKNSRTVRGNIRKTVGSGHKAPPAPK